MAEISFEDEKFSQNCLMIFLLHKVLPIFLAIHQEKNRMKFQCFTTSIFNTFLVKNLSL